MRKAVGIILMIALIIGFIAMLTVGRSKVKLEGKEYILMQGDTLWGIAEKYCPSEMDLRDYIDKVEKANGIKNGNIYAGNTITIFVEGVE